MEHMSEPWDASLGGTKTYRIPSVYYELMDGETAWIFIVLQYLETLIIEQDPHYSEGLTTCALPGTSRILGVSIDRARKALQTLEKCEFIECFWDTEDRFVYKIREDLLEQKLEVVYAAK